MSGRERWGIVLALVYVVTLGAVLATMGGCDEQAGAATRVDHNAITPTRGLRTRGDCEEFDYATTRNGHPVTCLMLRCFMDRGGSIVPLWCDAVGVDGGAK